MLATRFTLIAAVLAVAAGGTIARGQGNSKEIMSKKPAELVEILRNPKASTFEKAKACQRLAVAGAKESVPALAALLPDEKLNAYARYGLEGIADAAADEALRDAAGKLRGRPLVGVLDSIGQRRDAKAVGLLAKFLTDRDAAVASAAAGALGRIGTIEAGDRLMEAVVTATAARTAAADGLLACAERLAAGGGKKQTEKASIMFLTAAGRNPYCVVDLPKHLKIAGLRGVFRLLKAAAKGLLLEQLGAADKDFFDVGLAAAREVPGPEVTAALAGMMEKLPPERQALLLLAIGDRKDSAPAALFLAASKSEFPAVREAAIRVFVKHGDASVMNVLLDAAVSDPKLAQIARDGLARLPGKEVDDAIFARLTGANAKAKVVVLDLIGARQIVAAEPAVRRAMNDGDQAVRSAALAAIAQLIDVKDLDLLIDRAFGQGRGAIDTAAARKALQTAAKRMGDRDACATKLAEHLKQAPAEKQAYLLDLLGRVGGAQAIAAVAAAARSSDPAAKDAATRVLGEWQNADAAPTLLQIAQNDPETKYRIRALRGYIRIARQLEIPWWMESDAEKTKLAMFDKAMAVARRNEEKRLALDILTRIPSATSLARATAKLDNPELKRAAADAAVKIADQLVRSEPKPVADAMQKIVAAGVGGAVESHAKLLLDRAKAGAK